MICRRCGRQQYPTRNMFRTHYRCRECGGVLDFEGAEIKELDTIRRRNDRLSELSEYETNRYKFAFAAWPGRCVSPPVIPNRLRDFYEERNQ